MKQLLPALLLSATALLAQAHPSARAGGSPALPAADLALLQQATNDLRNNHLPEAISGLQRVVLHQPRFAEAYLNLGLALTRVSRNEEAADALEKAVTLKPAMRGTHLFLAIAEYKLGRLEPAAKDIRKETALAPADAQAWMWQGIVDLSLDRLSAAVEDLDHASALDATNVDILYHRGRAALALSRRSYEAMFAADPHSWHVAQVLAEADVEQARDADAVEQFKQAIAAAPPQSGLYEAMGSSLWRLGKFEEAEQAFGTALKIDANDTLTMYKLGCLRVDRGDAKGGKPLLDRVAVLDPSLKLTAYYLGRASSELGDDRTAVTLYKKVIAENVDQDTTKQAYFQLSRAYRRLHDDAASAAAQAQYRLLDQQSKDAMQEKLARRQKRADRDISIPAPAENGPAETP